jgi:hypothetical protein
MFALSKEVTTYDALDLHSQNVFGFTPHKKKRNDLYRDIHRSIKCPTPNESGSPLQGNFKRHIHKTKTTKAQFNNNNPPVFPSRKNTETTLVSDVFTYDTFI